MDEIQLLVWISVLRTWIDRGRDLSAVKMVEGRGPGFEFRIKQARASQDVSGAKRTPRKRMRVVR